MSERLNPEESNIANYLSVVGESAGDPTIVELYKSAESTISQFGKQTTYNSLPAEKLDLPVVVKLQNKVYEVGMVKVDGLIGEGRTISFSFKDKSGVEEVEHLGVAFLSSSGVLFTPSAPGEHTETNQPEDIKLIKKILNQAEKEAVRKRTQEQWRADRTKQNRRLALASMGFVGVTVVGGTQLPLGEWFSFDETKFDKHEYSLSQDDATIIHLNETAIPGFSEELKSSAALAKDKVPELGGSSIFADIPTDEKFSVDEGMRQLTITSSKDSTFHSNCSSGKVEGLADGTELLVWTDFTDKEGESRAEELEVSLSSDEVKVCWNGKETSDDDDPRIVMDLR